MRPEGLTMRSSHFGPKETMDRLEAAVAARGMVVLARVNHASAAESIGITLRPTELLIFRCPRAEAAMMQVARTIGIDLPLRALVWQDDEGNTCLTYNDPRWLASRHGANGIPDELLQSLTMNLASVVREVTKGTATTAGRQGSTIGHKSARFEPLFLEQQRARLQSLRAELIASVSLKAGEASALGAEAAGEAHEYEDDAQKLAMLELDSNLVAHNQQRLARVERALQKITDGTYGLSDDTGELIARERLELVPDAI